MSVEIIGDEDIEVKVLTEEEKSNQLSRFDYFPTSVYTIQKPEFLETVLEIANGLLVKRKEVQELDEIYPVMMTDNFFDDPRAQEFASYVGHTAWNILNSEGYAMDQYNLRFSEMWVQEHHKHSLMEHHVHGFGAQMSGFYFLETPENCSRVVIHDPRPGKVQINLPQKDMSAVTGATSMVNFLPVPGMLMFAPPWLGHSFGRHAADSPIKFVHFNLFATFNQTDQGCPAEIVEEVVAKPSKKKKKSKK